MPKNIVICCDGTANEFSHDRTNVIRLYDCLDKTSPLQIAFYHPGLGTMEPSGALSTPVRKITRVLGMAFGYGLPNDVRDAYVYLMDNYEKEDRVFLFGFSRGAYTVKVVCSLLHMYGLLYPGNAPLVPYAIRMMMAIQKINERKQRDGRTSGEEGRYFKLSNQFRESMSRAGCRPYFVGLWDTVSSVGWKTNPLKVPHTAFNPSIQIARHAISIDERRAFFRPNRWKEDTMPPRDIKQVWFAGVHADVGGGYPDAESGLSRFPFEWMLEEAKYAGLLVNPEREERVLGPKPFNPDAIQHESLKGWWQLAEWVKKPHYNFQTAKMETIRNRGRRRTIPDGALVHESVFLRDNGEYAKKYLPVNVVRTPTIYADKAHASAG